MNVPIYIQCTCTIKRRAKVKVASYPRCSLGLKAEAKGQISYKIVSAIACDRATNSVYMWSFGLARSYRVFFKERDPALEC